MLVHKRLFPAQISFPGVFEWNFFGENDPCLRARCVRAYEGAAGCPGYGYHSPHRGRSPRACGGRLPVPSRDILNGGSHNNRLARRQRDRRGGANSRSRAAGPGSARSERGAGAAERAAQTPRGPQPRRPEDPAPGRRPRPGWLGAGLRFHSVFDPPSPPGSPPAGRTTVTAVPAAAAPSRAGGRRAQRGGAGGMAVSWRSWLANEGVKHLCLVGWRARLSPCVLSVVQQL